jgi:PAS domain S-box-containing protein
VPISLTVSPIEDEDGTIIGASKIARDITEQKRAEEALRQQREWLRVTLASIGDAVITTDTAGQVTFLNPVAESLTGWGQEQAQGQPLEAVFPIRHEQTRSPVENPVAKVIREGIIVGLGNHTVLVARDGTERPIDDSAAPIRGEKGETVGVVLIFRDVTEQRQAQLALRQSEARKTAILDTALDAIITIDHEGKVVEFNPAAERTFGYRGADVVGR